jgi:hypothetical protein
MQIEATSQELIDLIDGAGLDEKIVLVRYDGITPPQYVATKINMDFAGIDSSGGVQKNTVPVLVAFLRTKEQKERMKPHFDAILGAEGHTPAYVNKTWREALNIAGKRDLYGVALVHAQADGKFKIKNLQFVR